MNYLKFFNVKKFEGGGLTELVDLAVAEANANLPQANADLYGGWDNYLKKMEAESEAWEAETFDDEETKAIKADPTLAADNMVKTGNVFGKEKTSIDAKDDLLKAMKYVTAANNTSGTTAKDALNGIVKAVKTDNPMAGVGAVFNAGVDMADQALMGDRNFDAKSQATDDMVNGATNALMASGNPAAIGVAMAIKGVNFLDKSLGKTIPGFDVNIPNDGFGGVQAQDENSLRASQLGNLNQKLDRRNQQAEMALAAANISSEQSFQQEARMNSVQNTMMNNQIALNGGLSTDLLAAKKGAKLKTAQAQKKERAEKWMDEIIKAQDGAKIQNIQTSAEPNVIPEGDYHKNKHYLDLENITEKGIPVIQVPNDNAETFAEIKQQEDQIVQSAEIERAEVTFNLELTNYIEKQRTAWHKSGEKDDQICLEVGMRLVKELLTNTNDNANVISKMEEKING